MSWESEYETEVFKAKLYANEPERLKPQENGWVFHGENGSHFIRIMDGHWVCDCHTFRRKPEGQESCAHTRAMEKMGMTVAAVETISQHFEVASLTVTSSSEIRCLAAAE